jgi:riboflavin kinase/FMN adenylyltransferase
VWIASSLETIRTPTLIALGNFDGLHRGHQAVVQTILSRTLPQTQPEVSRQVQPQSEAGRKLVGVFPLSHSPSTHPATGDRLPYKTVVTFWPHPRAFFSGTPQSLLTPLTEKAHILEAMGVDQLVLLPFDYDLANLTPQAFVEDIVVQRLQAQFISVGQDFCFGRQRTGTTETLRAIAAQFGIETHIVPLQCQDRERISSSAIRQALAMGEVEHATRLLGRPYSLSGEVEKGQQLGRTLGFPTANLQIPSDKFLPRQGVYAVWVRGIPVRTPAIPGVMNLGCRPTVAGTQQTLEVHVLDWTGDLYGQSLTVDLVAFLRPEQQFAGLEDLKTQIQQDCATARQHLHTLPLG